MSDYILSFTPGLNIGEIWWKENSKLHKSININNSLNSPISNSQLSNEVDSLNNGSSLLSILGLIVMGAGSVILVLFVGEYFAPSITHSIPGVESFMESLKSSYTSIISWWYQDGINLDRNPHHSPRILPEGLSNPYDPESISRSSSGSSGSITISEITPRPTPVNSPVMFPTDQTSSNIVDIPEDITPW